MSYQLISTSARKAVDVARVSAILEKKGFRRVATFAHRMYKNDEFTVLVNGLLIKVYKFRQVVK